MDASPSSQVRRRILARGIVQGVGFRPFVYRLARSLGLTGHVTNLSGGVVIEIEGSAAGVDEFVARLQTDLPPLARIRDLDVTSLQCLGGEAFEIHHSQPEPGKFALVPTDVATCPDCLRDFTDPANRRHGYAFTNCTNCGPRYSIIQDIPYDRPKTTMSGFPMCAPCQAEYDDPADRRFHAQPNACRDCGPELELLIDPKIATEPRPSGSGPRANALVEAQRLLREGKILAVKGLGGFHLACDASNDAAVRRLRERKRRSDKAFALMAHDLDVIERYCIISAADREALESPRRPIVLLPRRPDIPLSSAIAPGNSALGFMLPYTPLHYLLLDGFEAFVMTSGNVSEEPIVSRNEELHRLADLADAFLVHNRPIQTRVDDSVIRTFDGAPMPVRRSRGYAPDPIDLDMPVREILACGGELKNAFCLTKDRYAILSQHIGDLENFETLEFFRETLDHMRRFFRVEPVLIAHDLHPGYLGTRYAESIPDIPKIGVQHHHAHIASCMAENRLREKVIGVAFDGSGYGTDGQIWGGEFLVCDFTGFERRAHFRYIPLPGGDSAVRQPWRVALSYLIDTFGNGAALSLDLPLLSTVNPSHVKTVASMIAKQVNTIQTSSCGRLFDAVASIVNVRQETNYEGQAAIELEALAVEGVDDVYPFELADLDMRPTIAAVVRDLQRSVKAPVISAAFHNTVAQAIVETCLRIEKSGRLRRVCLSGGTFQNVYLLRRTVRSLRQHGFEVFLQTQVPANDGGLSLGQAMIANASLGSLPYEAG